MTNPSRETRGLKRHLCCQCRIGIAPGEPATFDPKCARCQDKKATGLRTGNEPMPEQNPHRAGGLRVKRLSPEKFRAFLKRQKAAAIVRARGYATEAG
jgi:hypothetical protein